MKVLRDLLAPIILIVGRLWMLCTIALEPNWWNYHILRGQYDFCVISEANSFAVVASMPLMARGSGAVDIVVTLESVDVEEIRSVAKGVQYTPPSG